jgi:hypothetical protein
VAGCRDSAVLPSAGAPVAMVPNGSSRGEGVVRVQVVRVPGGGTSERDLRWRGI